MLLSIVLVVGCSRELVIEPSGRTVKIGVIAPLSGSDEAVGKSGLQGVELARALHPLLHNGDQLELIIEDDQTDPEKAVEALDRLDAQGVAAILVLSLSNTVLALSEQARRHGRPLLATIATHPDLTRENPHLVQLSFDDALQAAVAALFLRDELLLSRAAVFSEPDAAHSKFLADEFISQFTEANGTVQDHVQMSGTNSLEKTRLQAMKEDGVEVLYLPVRAEHVLHIARRMNEINWQPRVMSSDGLLSELLLNHADEVHLAQNFMATDMHSSLLAKTSYGKDIVTAYEQLDQPLGSTFTVLGSEGLSILFTALNRTAPPYAARDLQRQLRRIKHFEGYAGVIAISGNGKAIRPVYVNRITDRKLEYVVKVY